MGHLKLKILIFANVLVITCADSMVPSPRIEDFNSNADGFQPSNFERILAILSGGGQQSSETSQRRILTSVSRPGLSLGSLGATLQQPSSEVISSQSSLLPPQPSFAPRILSLPDASDSQDDAFLFRPVIEELHSVSKPPVPIEIPRSSEPPRQQTTITLKDVSNNITPGDDTIDDDDIDSLPISTVIPAIISAMNDKTTSPRQQSSLISLLSDMVELQSERQQKKANNANVGNAAKNSQRVQGGVDFSQATRTEDGRLCVIKEDTVESLSKEPVLECTHRNIEKCHYTYITQFIPSQEEECEENFEKSCQITFRQEAVRNTVRKCYRPQVKVCNGQGEEQCRTVYETDCTTQYRESNRSTGKFVGDTKCEKLPVEICGRGCVVEQGNEECHDKQIDSLVDVPEEICDLNPQKTCRLVTKLIPKLEPKEECTIVPQESCNLKFTNPAVETKPLRTEWCLDESEAQDTSIESFGRAEGTVTTPRTNIEFPSTTIRPILAEYQSSIGDLLAAK